MLGGRDCERSGGGFISLLIGARNKVGSSNAPFEHQEKKRQTGLREGGVRASGLSFPTSEKPVDISNVERRAALPAARRGPWADNNNNMLDRRLQLYLVGDSLGHHTHDHNQVSTDS